jgi:hypothetical protein
MEKFRNIELKVREFMNIFLNFQDGFCTVYVEALIRCKLLGRRYFREDQHGAEPKKLILSE